MMQVTLLQATESFEQVPLHEFLKQPWDILSQEHLGKVQLSGLSQNGDGFIRKFAMEHRLPLGTLGSYAVLLTFELCEIAFERCDSLGLVVFLP